MLDQFARQNRWWLDASLIAQDRHLLRMRAVPLTWEPALPFDAQRDAVYTVRGPRQVGKSTLLKRHVASLLANGWPPRHILFLDVELAGIEKAPDLVAALRAYLDAERALLDPTPPRLVVLLDEVSRVHNWAGGLRGLIDNDELRGVTLIATGSHTRDLREGGERLPGRRGGGSELDLVLLPLSFREYVGLVEPALPLPDRLQLLDGSALAHGAAQRIGIRPRLGALFRRYLATGGFLMSLNDEVATGGIRSETFDLHRAAISGEFTRAGLRERYLREVVGWLASHLGQEFDARGIAADTDIGSKDTAQHYVEMLVASYMLLVSYRANDPHDPAPAFRSPRKAHPMDPLIWHLLRAWAAADPDPWLAVQSSLRDPSATGHLVESVLTVHLRRAFGERVFYWRPGREREVDFVVAVPGTPVRYGEAKYQARVRPRDAAAVASLGGGFMATLAADGWLAPGVYAIPAAELLVLLDSPSLAPARP